MTEDHHLVEDHSVVKNHPVTENHGTPETENPWKKVDNKTDKLFKIPHFVDLVTTQFSENYTVHQPVTIDEAMIPYKGGLSFKQYMKNKPTKWGIKVFVLSDATNGYIYRLQIYTGKNLESTIDTGLCSRVYFLN